MPFLKTYTENLYIKLHMTIGRRTAKNIYTTKRLSGALFTLQKRHHHQQQSQLEVNVLVVVSSGTIKQNRIFRSRRAVHASRYKEAE